MNNSLAVEVSQEKQPIERLREREAKLVRLLEAILSLTESAGWSTLKEELFDEVLGSIETRLRLEAEKPEINLPELYRLQGERKWAKRYASPTHLAESLQTELVHIRKQINPPTAGE